MKMPKVDSIAFIFQTETLQVVHLKLHLQSQRSALQGGTTEFTSNSVVHGVILRRPHSVTNKVS